MSNPVTRVVDWLRAGYPEGVPPTDYFPLIALLQRQQLAEDDVRAIAHEVVFNSGGEPVNDADIGTLITKVTNELPHPADVSRVAARLAAGGWPLADPSTDGGPDGAAGPQSGAGGSANGAAS